MITFWDVPLHVFNHHFQGENQQFLWIASPFLTIIYAIYGEFVMGL